MKQILSFPALWGLRTIQKIRKSDNPGFNILLFHHVSPNQMEKFDALISYIIKLHGILSPFQAEKWITENIVVRGPRPDSIPCLLTFDDGFESNIVAAKMILEPKDLKAVFFVCPGLIEFEKKNQQKAVADKLFPSGKTTNSIPPLMEWSQIMELHSNGHTIGAHSMTHARLSKLSKDELESEIGESRVQIEDKLSSKVRWFAYPFGDVDSIDRESLKHIKDVFEYCRTGIRGRNTCLTNPFGMLAQHIDLELPHNYQKLILHNGLDFRYRKARKKYKQFY
ncbi:MAG: polysaccharide deacetylase family protein [Pseudomonadota bacterium]|nr:polysaccharide deacetylase family protein [Pseudomonadota bacterium]